MLPLYVGALESALYTEVSFIRSVLYQRFHCTVLTMHETHPSHLRMRMGLLESSGEKVSSPSSSVSTDRCVSPASPSRGHTAQ